MGQGVADEMDATPLPARALQHRANRRPEECMFLNPSISYRSMIDTSLMRSTMGFCGATGTGVGNVVGR